MIIITTNCRAIKANKVGLGLQIENRTISAN